jgi:hypothetical protein
LDVFLHYKRRGTQKKWLSTQKSPRRWIPQRPVYNDLHSQQSVLYYDCAALTRLFFDNFAAGSPPSPKLPPSLGFGVTRRRDKGEGAKWRVRSAEWGKGGPPSPGLPPAKARAGRVGAASDRGKLRQIALARRFRCSSPYPRRWIGERGRLGRRLRRPADGIPRSKLTHLLGESAAHR